MAKRKSNKQARILIDNYFVIAYQERIENGSSTKAVAIYKSYYGVKHVWACD